MFFKCYPEFLYIQNIAWASNFHIKTSDYGYNLVTIGGENNNTKKNFLLEKKISPFDLLYALKPLSTVPPS
jgi:hypothetical protein